MTVPIPVTETTITTEWGEQVASDVNGLLARMTTQESANADARLDTAESEIDALQSITAAVGARNTHTSNPGQTISTGGSCQWDVQEFRSGLTVNEDFSGWTVLVAGVYSISWATTIASSWVTKLDISGSIVKTAVQDGATTEGTWVGYLPAGATIVVRGYGTGSPTTFPGGGYIHIYRVAQGG